MKTRRAVLQGLSATGLSGAAGMPAFADHGECHVEQFDQVGDWTMSAEIVDRGSTGYIALTQTTHEPSGFEIRFPVYDTNAGFSQSELDQLESSVDAAVSPFLLDPEIRKYLTTDDNSPIWGTISVIDTSQNTSASFDMKLFATTSKNIVLDNGYEMPTSRRYNPTSDTYYESDTANKIGNLLFKAATAGSSVTMEYKAQLPSGERLADRFRLNAADFNTVMDKPYFISEGRLNPERGTELDCPEGCFLTTACCEMLGRPDDGFELTTLRGFRDRWLSKQPAGAVDISLYYELAPQVCAAIEADSKGKLRLWWVYLWGILPSIAAIKLGYNHLAYAIYKRRMKRLGRVYDLI
ncbi:MAG: CFI-box-CTERM domain-containing protein [Pseudomonadota bacterium]